MPAKPPRRRPRVVRALDEIERGLVVIEAEIQRLMAERRVTTGNAITLMDDGVKPPAPKPKRRRK